MTSPLPPSHMKAAVLKALSQPLDMVSDIAIPAPQRGQVLVKLAYSGVCHSQLMEVRGLRGPDAYLPHLLGHEGSAKVIAIGEGVTKVIPGDLVILGWIKGSGLDGGGIRYECGHLDTSINAGGVTTFNEYALVSENRVVPLPAGIPLDVAVLFGCALPTGAGIVLNDIRPPAGSTVAVFGLGGIGMSALMATQLFDCAQVIAVDVSADKLELSRSFGATAVVDAKQSDPVAAIRALTNGTGVDYAIEASGQVSVIEQAFASVRRGGGTCVFASHPAHGARISIDPYELICGKQIRGSWGGSSMPDRDIPLLAQLYLDGKLPLEKLISHRYRLDQINEALDDMEQHRVGRPLIEIDTTLGQDR
ncbi:zinc-binding dehydrogenase [Herbaspirillum sp. RTI4]|uniref:zinc-binding dehydrogenase n=1 Tax=Herbaspirillum sp. RTI4 TaxID=3048640 RepID=UPI002AB54627|nr:zinc-binding dehydrogenase [Herbaspirillum sp. RTI4]MDY7577030.1 zinc-binding dehydrogenase [Herbaspirillum sp. RTI4]MEA9983101.1 zinc-binding dehydrogenase [Herbaspirillum sp. RTI4]